jgi:formyl-CoA transferase
MSRPLEGVKIVELGQLIAAPFAGKFFADFGAEVIKIEPPGTGDPLRVWRTLHEGTSLWWYVQNRNKKSVTANLRVAEGQEIVRRLAKDADVLIENFRPGTMEKWGLGYEALATANPGLVMLRLSGFGQTGPLRDQAGFGTVAESMGGLRYVTGFPDRPPVRPNISIGDSIAALHGVIGTMMALHARNASGKGQVVDVALYEAVFNMMESALPEYAFAGTVREREGTSLTGIVPSNTYLTRDRQYVAIGANADSIFKRLMELIGRADLGEDPALADNAGRVKRREELDRVIGGWTAQHDVEQVVERLNKAQVPSGKIYSVADIASDP